MFSVTTDTVEIVIQIKYHNVIDKIGGMYKSSHAQS